MRRLAVLALSVALAASACSDGSTGAVDGGGRAPDAEVEADGGPVDAVDAADAGALDLGALDADPARPDADPLDASTERPDLGPAAPGAACETAGAWDGQRLVGTTTLSTARAQLSCASSGSSATAPEVWWVAQVDAPEHLILRLGTSGWDGVVAVRTGTCAPAAERCSDAPTTLELPAYLGPLYVAVDGFANEGGPYALSLERSPALEVPPVNAACDTAAPLQLPAVVEGHDFGALPLGAADCPLAHAVYYPLDLAAATSVAVRVAPRAGQELDLAILDGCGGAVLACGAGRGRGAAERLGPLQVGPGRVVIAVGTRTDRPTPGSFELTAVVAPACTSDVECPLEERCDGALGCAPRGALAVVSAVRRPIPDATGRVEVPVDVVAPPGRVARVRARVVLEHPYPEDLVVELRSPTPLGGGAPIRVRLRDRSADALDVVYGADVPAEGPGALDDFLLVPDASGTWVLSVEDRAPGDQGFVVGLALEVEPE